MTLRLRLVLLVGAVIVGSLAAIFFGSSRLVRIEIQKLESLSPPEDPARNARHVIATALASHYKANGWNDIQPLLTRLQQVYVPGRVLLLVSGRTDLVAASSLPPGGVRLLPRGANGLVAEYDVQGSPVRVMVYPEPAGEVPATLFMVPEWRRQPLVVTRSLNRRLLWMIAGIGALALLATVIIARQIVRPVEQLQRAVQQVSRGALGEQVTPTTHDEVGQLASAFNAMSAQLARDDAMRRNMVNDVAHELRTPLTRMLCAVEAAQDGLRPTDGGVLTALHDDLTLLKRLVEDLETLALAEAGKLPLHSEPIDLANDVTRWVDAQSDDDRARIDLQVSPGLVVSGDRVRIQQILANLVRNALAHGGVTARVRVSADRRGDAIRLTVADDGSGIDPAHLPYVFDRFYRADVARGRGAGGSGLGLAIVQRLVELHRGCVSVESVPARFTAFHVDLPASTGQRFSAIGLSGVPESR